MKLLQSFLTSALAISLLSVSACTTSVGNAQNTGDTRTATKHSNTEGSLDVSKYQQFDFCPKVTKESLKACHSQGGTLQKQGRAQCYACTITYSDAGKTCRDHSDCQGKCYSNKMVNPDMSTSGQCSVNNSRFGCRQEVVNGKASGGMLCVD